MRKHLLVFCVVCFNVFSSHGQRFLDISSDIKQAEKRKDTAQINRINECLLNKLYRSHSDSFIEFIPKIISTCSRIGYSKGLADALVISSFYYDKKGETSKSYDSLAKARVIYENLHDTAGIIVTYTNSGVIFFKLKNYKSALGDFSKAAKLAELKKSYHKLYQSYYLCGLCHTQTGNYHQAEKYLKDAEAGYVYKNLQAPLHECYTGLAELYEKKKNYTDALKYYQKNYDYFLGEKEYMGVAVNAFGLGKVYGFLHDDTKAILYLKEAYRFSLQTSQRYKRDEFVKGISDYYLSLKDYKNAYNYLLIFHNIHDSLFNNDHEKTLSSMQTKLDLARKSVQIENLNSQHQRDRYGRYFSIGVAIILLLIALVLYSRFRYKSIANKKLNVLNTELEQTLENLKATQAKLVQQEKLASLGAVTAGIAHEMKNPLNFINNFSDLTHEIIDDLKEASSEDERNSIIGNLKKYMEKISHHGKRAANIVNGMLKHGRNDMTEKNETDINHVCEEALAVVTHHEEITNPDNKVDVVKFLDAHLPKLHTVESDISRVLLNILTNAFYAVKNAEHPSVILTTEKRNDFVIISIKDNGVGMSNTVKEKIFEPFFTTKPPNEGTGLGLSISYDIITSHGGNLDVISEEGKGTEFVIYLPV